MKNKYDILTFSKLAVGAGFYLNEAFRYVNAALSDEVAAIIFSKELASIDLSAEDRMIIEKLNLPADPVEILQADLPDVLTENTLNAIDKAWNKAQLLSKTQGYKFGHRHIIDSVEMLGHLNNFGFFIETLVNRHLLFLNEVKKIDDFSYARLSVAKVMERLIFVLKDDLKTNKIQLNEISNLFSLRNKTVHYTPDNANALKPEISKIIQIWEQTKKVLIRFEKDEKFSEDIFSQLLSNRIKEFKNKWT
jgi:hypothetical protein